MKISGVHLTKASTVKGKFLDYNANSPRETVSAIIQKEPITEILGRGYFPPVLPKDLEMLALRDASIIEQDSNRLSQLDNLKYLQLDNIKNMTYIPYVRGLQTLRLDEINFDADLFNASSYPLLQHLQISDPINGISAVPQGVDGHPSLRILWLTDGQIKELPTSNILEELNMSNNSLTAEAMGKLKSRLPALTELDLANNRLSGNIQGSNLPIGLTTLNLSDNEITNINGGDFRLSKLNAHNNKLTAFPQIFANKYILGFNNIAQIPFWVPFVEGLTVLSLEYNPLENSPANVDVMNNLIQKLLKQKVGFVIDIEGTPLATNPDLIHLAERCNKISRKKRSLVKDTALFKV